MDIIWNSHFSIRTQAFWNTAKLPSFFLSKAAFAVWKSCVVSKTIWQQTLKYLLSCPSEKEFVDPCSGWCFLPDRIYFCFWQAARVLEVSNRVKTEMEWASVATGYTSHTLLLLQGHALGVLDMVLTWMFTRAPLPWKALKSGFCHFFSKRFSTLFLVPHPCGCFPHIEDTPWGIVTLKY